MNWEAEAQAEINVAYSVFGWLPQGFLDRVRDKWRAAAEAEVLVANPVLIAVQEQHQESIQPVEDPWNYSEPEPTDEPAQPVEIPVISAVVQEILGVPVAEPPRLDAYRLLDTFDAPAQAVEMPTGSAPTVSVSVPRSVFAGQPFHVDAYTRDPDADLVYIALRQQGVGVLQRLDLLGLGAERGVRFDVPGVNSGPIMLRVEMQDQAGNGFTGEWKEVDVVQDDAPEARVINRWLTIQSVSMGPGSHRNVVRVQPGAPDIFVEAANQANATSSDFGGYTPQQLYNWVAEYIANATADQQAAGLEVGELGVPALTGTATQTIVAYQGNQPVYQQIQSDGQVLQWTQSGAGATEAIAVPNFGQYVAPAVAEIPNNLGQAINSNIPAGVPADNGTVQDVATNIPLPTFDPTHRLAGWDSHGNEVYRLTDEGGHVVEWAVLSGHDSREIVPGSIHNITGPGAQPTSVVSNMPPYYNDFPTLPPIDGAGPAAAGGSNTGLLLFAGVGVATWLWSRSRRSA